MNIDKAKDRYTDELVESLYGDPQDDGEEQARREMVAVQIAGYVQQMINGETVLINGRKHRQEWVSLDTSVADASLMNAIEYANCGEFEDAGREFLKAVWHACFTEVGMALNYITDIDDYWKALPINMRVWR